MPHLADSRYATLRLLVALALMTIGSSAMYVVAVVLPSVQADFNVGRADASLPLTTDDFIRANYSLTGTGAPSRSRCRARAPGHRGRMV